MQCGFCGTEVNPGFNTCPACKAVYQKKLGCVGTLFGLLGGLMVLAGLFIGAMNGWLLGLLVVAAGLVPGWLAGKFLAPYKWVQPTVTVNVRR
jgi:hypothetical protein